MQQLDQRGSHNNAVQIAGDHNTVTIRSGAARLTLALRHQRQRPPKKDLDLLDPYSCPIGLVGRRYDLDSLTAWLDGPAPIAVQCRIGRAGSGKTRLALELCKAAEAKGWTTGFLAHDELSRFQEAGHVRDWAWPNPTLVVIDYAATSAQPLRKWLEDLADRNTGDHPPLRLLLLERHASRDLGWWADLTRLTGFSTDGIEDLFDPPEPLELTRVSTAADRRTLLDAIMAEACKLTGKPAPPLPAPGADATFDTAIAQGTIELEPLYLLMAGLTAVQTGVPHVLSLTRTDLAERLAARELDRLAGLAKARDVDPTLVQHLAACIGLMNGCTNDQDQLATLVTEEATYLLHTLPTGPDAVARLLAETFASDQPDRLDPIRPDLIGEAAILETFKRHYRSPDWQAATATRAYDRAGPTCINVISRIAQDFWEGSSSRKAVRWLELLLNYENRLPYLFMFDSALPSRSTVLRKLSARLSAKIMSILQTQKSKDIYDKYMYVIAALKYIKRAKNSKFNQSIFELNIQLIDILRKMTQNEPFDFRESLAKALVLFGNLNDFQGNFEKAFNAHFEALALYCALREDKSTYFGRCVAGQTINIAIVFEKTNELEVAIQLLKDAVSLYRKCQDSDVDTEHELALCLVHLGVAQIQKKDFKLAYVTIDEALSILRKLAISGPDSFLADLANALNTQSVVFSSSGRRQEAVILNEESNTYFRKLMEKDPASYAHCLVGSIFNLSLRYAQIRRTADAVAYLKEGSEKFADLPANCALEIGKSIASVLNNICLELSSLEEFQSALAASKLSVKIYRDLVFSENIEDEKDLAGCLGNLSQLFSACNYEAEAIAASQESVDIFRGLVLRKGPIFASLLAIAIFNLATAWESKGDLLKAVDLNMQCILAIGELFLKHRASYASFMIPMVSAYFRRCARLDERPDIAWLVPIVEAIDAHYAESKP